MQNAVVVSSNVYPVNRGMRANVSARICSQGREGEEERATRPQLGRKNPTHTFRAVITVDAIHTAVSTSPGKVCPGAPVARIRSSP